MKSENIVLHLYYTGCNNIVSKYVDMETIIVHPIVSQSEMKEIYASADILIGVGNAVKDFLPSKTFEYIATRKPIVYFNSNNVHNKILDAYSLSLQLSDKTCKNENAARLELFCTSHKGNLADKDHILHSYQRNSEDYIKALLKESFVGFPKNGNDTVAVKDQSNF